MTNHICPPEQCTGCGTCLSCCPYGAVTLTCKSGGFFYPAIRAERCRDCGQCRESCPALFPPVPARLEMPDIYAAAASPSLRAESTSGGMFSALAQSFLRSGGAVFGAQWGDLHSDRPVYHASVRHAAALSALQGTKYLQSDAGNSFTEVRWLLSAGIPVLYCGTPCQIAGLYAAMGGERDGLMTCDLVCAGVPSPLLFRKWLERLEEREGSRVVSVTFRKKSEGWMPARTEVCFENGSKLSPLLYETSFGRGFGMGLTVRPCCDSCRFCRLPRMGDFTLGDFWGLEHDPETAALLDDNGGVSLLLVNSRRGQDLLEALRDELTLLPRQWEEAVRGNPRLIKAKGTHPLRHAFARDVEQLSYEMLERRYLTRPPAPIRMAAGLIRNVLKRR